MKGNGDSLTLIQKGSSSTCRCSRRRSQTHHPQFRSNQTRFLSSPWLFTAILSLVSFTGSKGSSLIGSSAECPRWLGLSSGAIQDWQIAVSSTHHGTVTPELSFESSDLHHIHRPQKRQNSNADNNNENKCQARFARLHNGRAWCAKHRQAGEWILVDLGVISQVTGILTQGRPESEAPDGEWVTSYSVSYSQDAFKWSFVTGSGGSRRIFRGNSDAGTVRQNQLDPPLSARFIRLHVAEWRGRPSLRLELTGCQECNQIITESAHVRLSSSTTFSSSVRKSHSGGQHSVMGSCQPEGAHLFSHTGWCAKKHDAEQWLQFDLGPARQVTGIITRGYGGGVDLSQHGKAYGKQHKTQQGSFWVTSYTLSYSNDSILWFSYRDGNHLDAKVFGGNVDRDTERRHYLNHPFNARYVRLHPRGWHGPSLGLRSALLGCPWKAGQDCGPGFFSLNSLSGCQENLAFHRTTWLNDKRHLWKDWKYGRASLAVDGDTDANLHRCAILDNYFVDHPVWMVDLGRKHAINGVVIVTWQGKGQDKTASYKDYQGGLDRLSVYVSNKPRLETTELLLEPQCGFAGARIGNETGPDLFEPRVHIPCTMDLRGRYLYVRATPTMNRKSRLFFSVLCEVMVY